MIPPSVNRSILPSNEILHVQILHNQQSRPEAEPGRESGGPAGRRRARRREGEARAESSGVASGEARKPFHPAHPAQNLFEGPSRGKRLSAEAKLGAGAAAQARSIRNVNAN